MIKAWESLYIARMEALEERMEHLVREAMAEDVGTGDHSSMGCIPADAWGTAVLHINQEGASAWGISGRMQRQESTG